VKQKGMPNIHVSYQDGKVIVSQTDPYGRGLVWRQKFQVKLIYELGTSRTLTVDMDKPTVSFKVAYTPDFIIPNYDGRGYGNFTVDDYYTKKLPLRLITTRNDLNRLSLLQTIHDNYLMGNVTPSHFGELYRMMMKEKNPLIMSTAIDHMFKITSDMTIEQRRTLELCMMDLLGENHSKECRLLVIRKLAANAISKEVLDKIAKILDAHNDPLFSEHDYMEMAYRLAIVRPDLRQDILSKERARLKTEELRNEFDYVSQACNPSAEARTKVFNNLLKP
jgi:aminopeptidase N